MPNSTIEVGATDFKAKCLDYIQKVHDRKCNAVVITKRGKPFARLVPVEDRAASLFGCMKGLIHVHGDLTQPAGEHWEALED